MLTVIGILFFVYYLCICLYVRRWNSTFSRIWPILGLLCIGFDWGEMYIPIPIRTVTAVTGLIACAAVFSVLCCMVPVIRRKAPQDLDYLIVLGAKVDHRRITVSLALRLKRACVYLKKHDKIRVIVSGGQGKGEDISEAEAMKAYLTEQGIEPERIILEDSSCSTRQNLRFSAEKITGLREKKIGIVTNSFHMYRSCLIGREEGYRHLYPVTAKSEPMLLPNYLLREATAILILVLQRHWRGIDK